MTTTIANRTAAARHNDRADVRSRDHGGHVSRPGIRRQARALAKRGRRADERIARKDDA